MDTSSDSLSVPSSGALIATGYQETRVHSISLVIDGHTRSPSISPASKRLRSLSPNDEPASLDDLLSLSMDSILPALQHYNSPSLVPTASSSCSTTLRSILCPSSSSAEDAADYSSLSSPSSSHSPLSSPPLSRSISRRSSTSSKSVRFARCTNASVFPCLSGEEYDRTSIVPTCESESLELPKHKRSEAEGWIKCVERERKAAANKKKSIACTAKVVEGVNGLVQGGYFVGEERDSILHSSRESSADRSQDSRSSSVDQEEGEHAMELEDDTPALIQDDSSGDDSDGVLSALGTAGDSHPAVEETIDMLLLGPDEIMIDPQQLATPIKGAPLPSPSLSITATIRPSLALSTTSSLSFTDYRSPSPSHLPKKLFAPSPASHDDDDDDEEEEEDDHIAEDDDGHLRDREDNEDTATEDDDHDDDDEHVTKADRYGLCALGKYSRAEVFQSYDSLGGF